MLYCFTEERFDTTNDIEKYIGWRYIRDQEAYSVLLCSCLDALAKISELASDLSASFVLRISCCLIVFVSIF